MKTSENLLQLICGMQGLGMFFLSGLLKTVLKESSIYISFFAFWVIANTANLNQMLGYDLMLLWLKQNVVKFARKRYRSHWILLVANSDSAKCAIIKQFFSMWLHWLLNIFNLGTGVSLNNVRTYFLANKKFTEGMEI